MEYRQLGQYGPKVSAVCLGSWLTYGGATEEAQARACIERAYELGINFFDTANVYAQGEGERVVGRILRQFPRPSYVLATKVYFPMGPSAQDRGLSRRHILEQCDASLTRLGVEYLDLYQAHRYDPTVPLEETLRAFDQLVRQGKIRHYGVSEWSRAQLAQAHDLIQQHHLAPIISDQPYYNLLAREIEKEILPFCRQAGIGIINFSPLAQGVLTGKYKPGAQVPADSRASDPRQNRFLTLDADQLARVQKLVPLAQAEGLTLARLALAWCLRLPELSSVIIGATRPSQVEDNAGAVGKKLTPATLQAIDQIFEGPQ
ncbi:aldo/keto reductase family protein [Candidatus Cyanaurora vandensis]|uniref:aldo/keto reductase family protein n=1 Tax=Candidatus Cyanaurora vandensis TaxID=2714958 RepID=UPI0037BFB021